MKTQIIILIFVMITGLSFAQTGSITILIQLKELMDQ